MARNTLTKAEIKREIIRCGKDPVYFINNYAKIRHPIRGRIAFNTYKYQDDLIADFESFRFNVILKARQLGISTLCAAYVVWLTLFHRDKEVAILATKFKVAAKLVRKAKAILKSLPPWLRIVKFVVDNESSFELENGSVFAATSTTGDAGRSDALSLLIIDEAAFVEKMDEIWTSIYPTLGEGGKCVALSTPNGAGGFFYDTYIAAEEQRNDFKYTKIMWDEHPDHDEVWFVKETKNLTPRQTAQEHMCSFNMSGETVFAPEELVHISKYTREPKYQTGYDRNLWIWEQYVPGNTYFLSADVARGDGEDNSAFHVFKVETMEIVAEYVGKMEPDLFSQLIAQTGREYGECMVVVENNNVGFLVLEKLKENAYPNVYHSVKATHDFIEEYMADGRSGVVPGFTTSTKTRPLIIAKMEEYIRHRIVKINSVRLLNEMKTFIWNNSKAEAMRSYHDDLVISCAIGCFVKDNVFATSQRETEYKKSLLSAIKMKSRQLSTTIPGMFGHKINGQDLQHQMNYHLKIYKG